MELTNMSKCWGYRWLKSHAMTPPQSTLITVAPILPYFHCSNWSEAFNLGDLLRRTLNISGNVIVVYMDEDTGFELWLYLGWWSGCRTPSPTSEKEHIGWRERLHRKKTMSPKPQPQRTTRAVSIGRTDSSRLWISHTVVVFIFSGETFSHCPKKITQNIATNKKIKNTTISKTRNGVLSG